MTDSKTDNESNASSDASSDGRRQRSERSRHKIAAAMIELIMEGDITPSAEAVAERASVGLRSVFRHFKDMDSLFHEVSKIMRAEYDPQTFQIVPGMDWHEQLSRLIQARAEILDRLMPMQRSSLVQKHRSRFIQEESARTNALLRSSMLKILPEALAKNAELIEALDAVLSPSTWMRLRLDQGLSQAKAHNVTELMVTALVKDL